MLLKASLNILLEGVPEEVSVGKIGEALLAVPSVLSIHDLHVWAIGSGQISMTAHVVHQPDAAPATILNDVRERLAHDFEITHVTVQCELEPCHQTDDAFHFASQAHAECLHEKH